MEKVRTNLNSIMPSDTPARKAWDRVSKIKIPRWGNVDLDKLGIFMLAGDVYQYAPHDGMHRLARILDAQGYCTVEFRVHRGHEQLMDNMVKLTVNEGIRNLEVFLQMCKAAQFLREDTA